MNNSTSVAEKPESILNSRLDEISYWLDISLEARTEVEILYEKITEHLTGELSSLQKYNPRLYPQGSFRILTVVKPYGRHGDIDIDIVCELDLEKTDLTKKELKELVGAELHKIKHPGLTIKPSKRCWTLTLGKHLHIDILPAIPNKENPPTGIYLTDQEIVFWQTSNPKGYAKWFDDLNHREVILLKERMTKAEIEDIPSKDYKLSLQKTVQILKRHRDVFFKEKKDLRPPSVILTTLAGLCDDPSYDIFQKLKAFALRAFSHITNIKGHYNLSNPVDEFENFVDKWNAYPERKEGFEIWLNKLSIDLNRIENEGGFTHLESVLHIEELLSQNEILVSESTMELLGAKNAPGPSSSSHAEIPPWQMHQNPAISKIHGTIHKSKYSLSGKRHSENIPVAPDRWLKFRLETDLKGSYEIFWQIINTGKEALAVNALRGNIETVDGGKTRWEQTRYRGTHYVVAYLTKNNVLMSTARTTVKIF